MAHLIALAAKLAAPTKVAAKAALKAAGMRQTLADELLSAHEGLERVRKIAQSQRVARRIGRSRVFFGSESTAWYYSHRSPHVPWQRIPDSKPQRGMGEPQKRLDALRKFEALDVLMDAYRLPNPGHGKESVDLTRDPAQVGLKQVYTTAYNKGSKWGTQMCYTTITVPADWRVRVQRRELAIVDGMMTLDAAPMPAPSDVELYAATWLVQGRGYALTAVRGYIARSQDATYHADTAQAAIAGIGRKLRQKHLADAFDVLLTRAGGLDALAAHMPAYAKVTVADARATGACEYGIRSWCHVTGLDYEAGSAPLSDVLAAYKAHPRTEARAAIVRALRRYRAGHRLALAA